MELWQLLLMAALVLLTGGGAYYVATHRDAQAVSRAVLIAARQVVASYLAEHPPDAAALNAIIASGYYLLPPHIRARVPLETFEKLVLPLLYQAEEALRTPPPAGDRALWAPVGGDDPLRGDTL
jgi:hypothetical protein